MDAIDYAKSYRPAGSPVQEIVDPVLEGVDVHLLIKRDDLIHEHISGNKWRKLKYNLGEAIQQNHHTVLTFGGAFSNHISATAFACKKAGIESVGIIRGEDDKNNPTLHFARTNGMQLKFVSREKYKLKNEDFSLDELTEEFGRFFVVPEGGANGFGVRGCAEILPEVEEGFDVICCAAGTGTTLAGLAISLKEHQRLVGFPALKGGGFLRNEVKLLMDESRLRIPSNLKFDLQTNYHFGGYAKLKPELLEFVERFQNQTGIPLDPIYTGKMMFGIYDLIKSGYFENGSTILALHTGGLQGWEGMKYRGLI
ncbi:MAG: 1-aminocyclopropane-1-carboxylate deaminase [Bacteroidia bacterium]|jgi:1-aminocyclopropane-1-carboxylate deaminase